MFFLTVFLFGVTNFLNVYYEDGFLFQFFIFYEKLSFYMSLFATGYMTEIELYLNTIEKQDCLRYITVDFWYLSQYCL